jgi:hypothetical protein
MNEEKRESLRNVLRLIGRATLKGDEVDAFLRAVAVVRELIDSDDDETNLLDEPSSFPSVEEDGA